MPRASDSVWTQKLSSQHDRHEKFQKPKTVSQAFRVHHYAGWVEYQGAGFLEKNTDSVPVDLVSLLSNCTNSLVCELGDCAELLGTSSRPLRRSSFRAQTVANQFRKSLTELLDKLRRTSSHYIRCVKPNDSKDPFSFSSRRVVGQLRACGVLETVRISAEGYPSRLSYQDFSARYSLLVPNETNYGTDAKQISCSLLASTFQQGEKYQLGRTKVFLRSGAVAYLERERTKRLETAVVAIQALARGVSVRSSFRRARSSVIVTQCHARGILLRRALRERSDSVGTQYRLLLAYRGRDTHRQAFLRSLVRFQATSRSMLLERQRQLSAVILIQSYLRGFLARDIFRRVKNGVTLLQACVRRRIVQRQFRDMKANRRVEREEKDWGLEKKIFQLQRRLSAKEFENCILRNRTNNKREQRNTLERSYSVRAPRPCVPLSESDQLTSLRNQLELDRSLHRQQMEQLRLAHRRERDQLIGQLEQARCENQKLSDSSFEIIQKESLLDNTDKRAEVLLRDSSPSGRSSGGIESGIDVSSVALDPWGRTRSDSDWLRFNELEIERVWICNLLEKFSPAKQSRHLSDLMGLLSPDLGPPPVSLTGTKHFPALLQLISDVTELRHEQSLNGRRDSLHSRSPSSLSFPAIPEGSSVGHKRRSSVSCASPLSRTTSLLTSSLSSSLEADADCLLQQIQSLKLANQLLHSELQAQQSRAERAEREKDISVHKLQQKIAAIRSMSYGARSPMEAKLQQEVSRLTQENMDVTSELESAQENLKTLTLSPAVSLSSLSQDAPSVSKRAATLKRGLLLCPREQEPALISCLVSEMRPNRASGLSPGLPAHLLFLCIRSADERQDERQVEALLSGCVKGVRQLIRQGRQDLHLLAFWLCNVSTLISDLKQFSGEEAYQVTNNASQRKECLQNFDLTDFRHLFNELCVGIYHDVITAIQDRIQHLVVPALLEHQGIPTVARSVANPDRRSRGLGKRSSSILREEVTIRDLIRELSLILEVLRDMGVTTGTIKQLMRQTFYFLDAVALNNVLLRKELCHWSRGLNVRHNMSQLEEWGRSNAHYIDSRALDALLPLIQSAQLLQINKKERDAADKICGVCADLSPLQIQKLLTMYTPANEFEERVPPSLIRSISQHFSLSVSHKSAPASPPKLMQDISLVYPPSFPYAPSSLLLSEVEVPTGWELSFLQHS